MRRVAVGLIGLAVLGALTGCSPGRNATIAIGYDPSGRLIAAVKVCHDEIAEVELIKSGDAGYSTVGTWERSSPLQHAETWVLRGSTDGPWASRGPELPPLEPSARYQLSAWSRDHQWGNHLAFSGRALLRVEPGEVLVARRSSPDRHGNSTRTLEAITLDDMADEDCGL